MAASSQKRHRSTPGGPAGTASGLNAKQSAFVREYLVDLNATQAAIRAGYSQKTAHSQGPRLLENVGIKMALAKSSERQAEKADLKAVDIINELRKIGMADIEAREAKAQTEYDAGPFGGVLERHRGSSLRYEHKIKALELLGKHLTLFSEKVHVSFENDSDEQLRARYQTLLAKGTAVATFPESDE